MFLFASVANVRKPIGSLSISYIISFFFNFKFSRVFNLSCSVKIFDPGGRFFVFSSNCLNYIILYFNLFLSFFIEFLKACYHYYFGILPYSLYINFGFDRDIFFLSSCYLKSTFRFRFSLEIYFLFFD